MSPIYRDPTNLKNKKNKILIYLLKTFPSFTNIPTTSPKIANNTIRLIQDTTLAPAVPKPSTTMF